MLNYELMTGENTGSSIFHPISPAQIKKENMIRFANDPASIGLCTLITGHTQSLQSLNAQSYKPSHLYTKYITYVLQATNQAPSLNVSKYSPNPLISFPFLFCAYYSGYMDSLGLLTAHSMQKKRKRKERIAPPHRQAFFLVIPFEEEIAFRDETWDRDRDRARSFDLTFS